MSPPCGLPLITSQGYDRTPFMMTYLVRLDRNYSIQANNLPLVAEFLYFANTILLSTLFRCFGEINVDHINIFVLVQHRDNVIMMGEELREAKSVRVESILILVHWIVLVKETS